MKEKDIVKDLVNNIENDVVNDIVVNIAQPELEERAQRLDRLVASRSGEINSVGFDRGVELVREIIENQSKLYGVYDMLKTALEQDRNLMLASIDALKQHRNLMLDPIDAMLNTLEQMSR